MCRQCEALGEVVHCNTSQVGGTCIGVNIEKQTIEHELGKALLSVEESEALGGIEGWNKLEDPFFHGMAASRYFEPNLVTSRKIEGVMSSRSVLNEA